MKNKKLIQEIIGEIPELKGKEKKLAGIIDVLKSQYNHIKINAGFKKELSQRIQNISAIKQSQKKKYQLFLIPAFSFMFVISGAWYYFSSTQFTHEGSNQGYFQPEFQSEIQQLQVVGETIGETDGIAEKSSGDQQVSNIEMAESRVQEDASQDSEVVERIDPKNTIQKKTMTIETPYSGVKTHEGGGENKQQIQKVDDKVDDNELIDLFGGDVENDDHLFEGSSQDNFVLSEGMFMRGSIDMLQESDYQENIDDSLEYYCGENDGEYGYSGEEYMCKIGDNICTQTQYDKGECSLFGQDKE